ncbi:MAG: hypothetical protein ABI867_43885, partial [Kofleriaceae bacterium]
LLAGMPGELGRSNPFHWKLLIRLPLVDRNDTWGRLAAQVRSRGSSPSMFDILRSELARPPRMVKARFATP